MAALIDSTGRWSHSQKTKRQTMARWNKTHTLTKKAFHLPVNSDANCQAVIVQHTERKSDSERKVFFFSFGGYSLCVDYGASTVALLKFCSLEDRLALACM